MVAAVGWEPMQSHWILGVKPPTSLGLTFPRHCVTERSCSLWVQSYPSFKVWESDMRHAEKLLEISEIRNIHFQSPGRLIRLLQLSAGGYLLINPHTLQRKSVFHLREKWDLLISHGAAFPQYDVPQGWWALTLSCRLNSQKVKWQNESRYSRCVKIRPN